MLLSIEGCDVNIRGKKGNTALMFCIVIGYNVHQELFNILIDHKLLDMNLTNNNQETYFTVATKLKRFNMASELLHKGSNLNHQVNKKNTMLITSCFEGNMEIFKYLLGLDADINLNTVHPSQQS